MLTNLRTYSELSKLKTFEERFEYLKLNGRVGDSTFGFDRVFNQMFYTSTEWKNVRDKVIVRDFGCDLGVDDYEIHKGTKIFIHHMNPMSLDDIRNDLDFLLNPEYLITTTHRTHNAIHYGNKNLLKYKTVKRRKNDTCPWK